MGGVSGQELQGVRDRRSQRPEPAFDGARAPGQDDHQGGADAPREAPGKDRHGGVPETLRPQQLAVPRQFAVEQRRDRFRRAVAGAEPGAARRQHQTNPGRGPGAHPFPDGVDLVGHDRRVGDPKPEFEEDPAGDDPGTIGNHPAGAPVAGGQDRGGRAGSRGTGRPGRTGHRLSGGGPAGPEQGRGTREGARELRQNSGLLMEFRASRRLLRGWRGAVAAGALALVLGGLTAAAGPLVQQAYQFRVTVDLISLNVTVTDARERFITDLIEEDFSVYEDGILQEIEAFSREDLPIRMVLLLDTSASMVDKMNFAQEAAVRFTRTLRLEDVAQVVEFGSNANILQKFTNDHGELEHAIRMTQAGGTTKLHNAMYISLRSLERQRMEARRQAIILLSDGRDTSSLVTFEQVLDLTKDTDVVIYSISLQNTARRRGRRFSEAEHVLKNLAEETGGQWFFPAELAELDSVYARIAEELKSQYNVGYISNNPRQDGAWRRIVVQTNRPDLRVRTKLGYYAPG